MEELVNDVTSLNVLENDEDSSSNWMVGQLTELAWENHMHFRDDRRHDEDTEMY
jgi:hypothetical protein